MVNNLKSEPRCTPLAPRRAKSAGRGPRPFRRRECSSSPRRTISAWCAQLGTEIGLLVFGMADPVEGRAYAD
jgi:hypothetical protein